MFTTLFKKILISLSTFAFVAGSIFAPTVVAATGDIVDVAINAPQFSTLVAAVKAADLVSTLQGAGPFTVLAPTNDAFAKLPTGVLAKLLLPENKASLVKVLTYHVISGKVDASQVVKLSTAKTVEGSNIKITVVDGKVKLNDTTTVITTDIAATNGIIHGIDTVLLPADLDPSKLVSATNTKSSAHGSKGNTVRTGGSSAMTEGFNIQNMNIFISLFLIFTFLLATKKLFSPKKY